MLVLSFGCGPIGFGPGMSDFSAQLPHEYFIHRNSAHQIFVSPNSWSPDTPIIPTKVIELDHDDRFVIAKQQLLQRRSPGNPNDTYEEPKPNAFQFWILDLRVPKAYGPLNDDEFPLERTRLGVSENLSLHDVYDYRP